MERAIFSKMEETQEDLRRGMERITFDKIVPGQIFKIYWRAGESEVTANGSKIHAHTRSYFFAKKIDLETWEIIDLHNKTNTEALILGNSLTSEIYKFNDKHSFTII